MPLKSADRHAPDTDQLPGAQLSVVEGVDGSLARGLTQSRARAATGWRSRSFRCSRNRD